jgi:hypothetical protein
MISWIHRRCTEIFVLENPLNFERCRRFFCLFVSPAPAEDGGVHHNSETARETPVWCLKNPLKNLKNCAPNCRENVEKKSLQSRTIIKKL